MTDSLRVHSRQRSRVGSNPEPEPIGRRSADVLTLTDPSLLVGGASRFFEAHDLPVFAYRTSD